MLLACDFARVDSFEDSARGTGGFGYDPHFFVPSLEQTAAELDAELKNTLSHRASAMRHLLSRLQGQFSG